MGSCSILQKNCEKEQKDKSKQVPSTVTVICFYSMFAFKIFLQILKVNWKMGYKGDVSFFRNTVLTWYLS